MGYDPNVCIAKLSEAGLTPACEAMSNPYHCDDLQQISPVIHQFCGQVQTYYAPVQALVCMYYNNGTPTEWKYWPPDQMIYECSQMQPQKGNGNTGWTINNCYCCCSCFAYDTMIAVPDGTVAIQEIGVGDKVLSAKMVDGTPSWSEARVTFSSGVKGGDHPSMVYISHGDDPVDLICNFDQPFILADGTLVRAGYLTLDDELMDKDGNAVRINLVAIGNYTGGIHHINTDTPWSGSPDGHLVLAGGVIAGDFLLQTNLGTIDADFRVNEDRGERPSLGTPEYEQRYGKRKVGEGYIAFSAKDHEPMERDHVVQGGRFSLYGGAPVDLGTKGASMFTRAQALDILKNGKQLPLSNPVPKSEISNIFHILQGFYPGYNFYLDWFDMVPNVYAFEEYGQKFVVISGGLARMTGLQYEGLMMLVADGLSRFIGLPPMTPSGWVGTGAADYYAFGLVSRAVWYGNSWSGMVLPAFSQVATLMGLISPQNAGGNPNYPVEYPSVECRLGAMQSGLVGGPLPECCGGEPVPSISIQMATAIPGGVQLVFSIAPLEPGVTDLSNYSTDPTATLTAAEVDPAQNFIVNLMGEFTCGESYTVTVSGLVNMYGGGMNPGANTATFTAS